MKPPRGLQSSGGEIITWSEATMRRCYYEPHEHCGPHSATSYESWIESRSESHRFASVPHSDELTSGLFPHQRALVLWALRKGRCAIFADTGLGKTLMQAEWARHVAAVGPVLILAPLAVAEQTVDEARRFGINIVYRQRPSGDRITITNYDRMDAFDPDDYAGIVLDESSILKSFDGKTRTMLIEAFANTPYRLACTATPAPNDHTELGNHSEFLGVKTRAEMLAEYFVHDGGSTQSWRLKGHAEDEFWRWVCTWAAVLKKPSDLGFDDDGYNLPPLRMHEHIVRISHAEAHLAGLLFAPPAEALNDQRRVRRATTDRRIEIATEIAAGVGQTLIWCEMNAEADACQRAIAGAVQVAGDDRIEDKRDRLLGFARGEIRVLVTKPKIAGHGMNWQRCSRMVFVGASHSYEQTYQAIRRCWRFGQLNAVDVHVIRAETEGAIVANFRRKEADAERLAEEMVSRVRDSMQNEIGGTSREWNPYEAQRHMTVPTWVGQENER